MKRPAIGITTGNSPFSLTYILLGAIVFVAGARPVRLRPLHAGRVGRRAVRVTARAPFTAGGGFSRSDLPLDAVILTGGAHISPTLTYSLDGGAFLHEPTRDVLELHLAHRARDTGTPILGICRGAQLLSVAGRGSLHASVREAYPNARYPHHPLGYALFRKGVRLAPGSLLRRITEADELHVNSLHRQAIDGIGAGLRVTAREENGVVQAVEDPKHPFYLGVQFHPELLVYARPFRRILTGLVEAARQRSAARRVS